MNHVPASQSQHDSCAYIQIAESQGWVSKGVHVYVCACVHLEVRELGHYMLEQDTFALQTNIFFCRNTHDFMLS